MARKVTGRAFCPTRARACPVLEQDAARASSGSQPREISPTATCRSTSWRIAQLGRVLGAVAGHLELLGPPGLDQLDVSSRISGSAAVSHICIRTKWLDRFSPYRVYLAREFEHFVLARARPRAGTSGSPWSQSRTFPASRVSANSPGPPPDHHVAAAGQPEAEFADSAPARRVSPAPRTSSSGTPGRPGTRRAAPASPSTRNRVAISPGRA